MAILLIFANGIKRIFGEKAVLAWLMKQNVFCVVRMATPASVVSCIINTDQLQNPTAMCPAREIRQRNVEPHNVTAFTGVKSCMIFRVLQRAVIYHLRNYCALMQGKQFGESVSFRFE